MPLEVFMPFKNDQYNKGLTLQEYAGSYWLVSSYRAEDGRVSHDWVFPSRNKQPIEKSLPWKIRLGDTKEEALETLRYFAQYLK